MSEQRAKWATLVYLAGDNNLSEEMVWSLQEMKKTIEVDTTGAFARKEVKVIVQYDARGANPRIYKLTDQIGPNNKGPAVDGKLSEVGGEEYTPKQLLDCVQKKIVPTPEQKARAVFHEDYGDWKSLYTAILREGIEEWHAECFLMHLLLLSEDERKGICEGRHLNKRAIERLSEMLTMIIQRSVDASEEEKSEAARIVTKHEKCILTHLKRASCVKKEELREEIQRLTKIMCRSSESLSKHMNGLSSTYLMEAFIEKQAEMAAPADNYLVVLSGHGSGAVGDFLTDDDPESSLSIPELRKLLEFARHKIGRKIEILGMDSCLMSMAEVCYEIQDFVRYVVGAEGFVPNTGWPYHRLLESVAKLPEPGELARELVKNHVLFYKDYDVALVSVDLAAVYLERIGTPDQKLATKDLSYFAERKVPKSKKTTLAELIRFLAKNLTATLIGQGETQESRPSLTDELDETGKNKEKQAKRKPGASIRDAVTLAHFYAQSYKGDQYVDLYDFCEQLKRFCDSQKIKDCAKAIMDKFDQPGSPVLLSCYWGADSQHSHGLSVYFPWSISDYVPEYSNLKFARETGWDEFIWTYLRSTLRVRRHQELHLDESGKPLKPMRFGEEDLSKEFLLLDQKQAQYGTAKSAQYGTARSAQWGTARSAQFGTARSAQYGTARSAQYGTARSAQYGTAKFLEKFPQSSIKNGPDGFYECTTLKKSKQEKSE